MCAEAVDDEQHDGRRLARRHPGHIQPGIGVMQPGPQRAGQAIDSARPVVGQHAAGRPGVGFRIHVGTPKAKAGQDADLVRLSNSGAGNESRTRDLNLGKVALYQLSYSRIWTNPAGLMWLSRTIQTTQRCRLRPFCPFRRRRCSALDGGELYRASPPHATPGKHNVRSRAPTCRSAQRAAWMGSVIPITYIAIRPMLPAATT